MGRIILQFLVLIALFFGCWFGLQKFDWLNVFKVQKLTESTEEKLGDIFKTVFYDEKSEIKRIEIVVPIDSLLSAICQANEINQKKIKLHVVENKQVNAFALPDGHLVIYSGLIEACENEAELVGIISHELAHIQMNHVMKKLIKEIGLSTLISITTGNGGSEIVKGISKHLSSTAYDRNLEKEADIKAVDYMMKAGIPVEPMANFLYRLSDTEGNQSQYIGWISTHPFSKDRAEYIIDYQENKNKDEKTILTQETWEKMKEKLRETNL